MGLGFERSRLRRGFGRLVEQGRHVGVILVGIRRRCFRFRLRVGVRLGRGLRSLGSRFQGGDRFRPAFRFLGVRFGRGFRIQGGLRFRRFGLGGFRFRLGLGGFRLG
ncbi:MAG TPA: hypothetical protein VNN79_17520, partial [Actinomycetota bacterium]|nr:hypothetical protein [Actinomycetota bacterium]